MTSLVQQTLTLVRRGDVVEGVESLHEALSNGWRVVGVRSEAPPDAAPLDFVVQVLLARTPHRHVGDGALSGEIPSLVTRPHVAKKPPSALLP